MTLVRFNYPSARGWVARARAGRFSKLFSDGKNGGPDGARAAAERFAADYLKEHPEEAEPYRMDVDRSPRANNRTGVPGVCLVTCSPRSRGAHAWTFWQAACPGGPNGDDPQWTKKLTCSVHGFHKARDLAERLRIRYVRARDEDRLAEFWREEGYDPEGEGVTK